MLAVRDHHGGLLAVLERHAHLFHVRRSPAQSVVALAERVSDAAVLPDSTLTVPEGAAQDDAYLDAHGAGRAGAPANAPAQPSRCLHVGNVSTLTTVAELRRSCEPFGPIESVKSVTQKGRRFAFVNFVHVKDAVAAKTELSKQPMFRSSIAFAKVRTW